MADGPVVSALRAGRRGRVLVELDGASWREVPVDVVARARLRVGERLDRERLRRLRRELRRSEALRVAASALRHRDLSTHAMGERLTRAGVGTAERSEALETLVRVGFLDDTGVALRRAANLADRGWGDGAIAADLERRGLGADDRAAALAALDPERERAARIVAARGGGPRTAAYLTRRGFGEDARDAAGAIAEEAP